MNRYYLDEYFNGEAVDFIDKFVFGKLIKI